MTVNFTLGQKYPEPEDALAAVTDILPDFKSYWNLPDNLFRDSSDGSFTHHGLFSELTGYVRERWDTISPEVRARLFAYIEVCTGTDANSAFGIANAVYTCFLENLAGEEGFSNQVRAYLGPRSKVYFDEWSGEARK